MRKFTLYAFFILLKGFNLIYGISPFFIRRCLLEITGGHIGRKSYIHTCRFFSFGKIEVGENSVVNSGCYLDNRRGITIGNNVNISHDVKMYTLGHDINSPDFETKGAPIVVGDNACIFCNVLIMPGVNVAEGTVVFPGSVLTKSTEPYGVYGGNPAVLKGYRKRDIQYKLDYGYWFAN